MTMDEILEQVISLAENDQTIADTSVLAWSNQAINRINTACQSNIPLVPDVGQTIPAFDSRFHEALVLFSVAKYREGDSDYNSSTYFMNQFTDMVKVMQRDMVILPSQQMSPEYLQIAVTDPTAFVYNLTIPFGSYFDAIDVYQNDKLIDPSNYTISLHNKTITFFGTVTFTLNDKITVHFQNNSDLNAPPYQWWANTGW